MRSRALTGTTVGSFDQLLVRSPAVSGPYEDILDVIGSGGSGGAGGSGLTGEDTGVPCIYACH